MPRLRVCGVVPIYCHPEWRGGGLSRTATDLLMALAQRGNKVTVISPLLDGERDFEMPQERVFCDGNLELRYVTAARRSPFALGTSAHGLNEAMKPLMQDCDVVHIHSFLSPWADEAAKIALRASVPYVIQDHGKLTPTVLSNRAHAKQIYLWFGGTRLLREAACVVPSAEVVAQAIRTWNSQITCESCTNGLDEREFEERPERPLNEPYVLFLGWLDPRKKPDLLVGAFAKIAERAKPWKLALVGPDSYGVRAKLEELIRAAGLQDRVVMPGMVHGTEKFAWLLNAGVFVLPSEGEGLSLSMLEAAASGLPLLLSKGCNYPEAEACGAGRILPLNDEAWADAMLEVISDETQRNRMGAAARQLFIERHTLKAVGEKLEDLLTRAIARKRAAADHVRK